MERLEFDDRDWESWYAQRGPNSGPMRTAPDSARGYEFAGHQPGMRPEPWPQARPDYQYYARQDYRDYSDEAADGWEPAPDRYSGGHGSGYRAAGNDSGYGSDPYGAGPYSNGPYGNDSYAGDPFSNSPYSHAAYGGDPYRTGSPGTGPYANDHYGTGADLNDTRREVMVADVPGPRRDQVARSPRDASVSTAARVLAAADQQAAAITQQASYQAAVITQQVAYEAAETRDAANREADQIMQRAQVQASAVREAAELEVVEMRRAVAMMQTELTDLATRITTTFPNPVVPRMPPAGRPTASPSAQPRAAAAVSSAMRQAAPPATKPADRLSGKPGTRSAAKPAGHGRQEAAMRFAVIATSALLLVAAVAGVTEIKLHGLSFFVFRSVGSGETGPGGLQEDQGPGQPDAPKSAASQSTARPILRPSIAVTTVNSQ